jgi:ribonuclease E
VAHSEPEPAAAPAEPAPAAATEAAPRKAGWWSRRFGGGN